MRPLLTLLPLLFLASCGEKKDSTTDNNIEEKPKPHHPWEWEPADPALVAGRQIYLAECSGCHNEGEEGAPSLLDHESWKKREAKGLATLLDHAINGYIGPDGEMPARGGTPSLTDQEVTNAVNYILAVEERSSSVTQ